MSKTTAIIIIVVALLAITGGVVAWYFNVSGNGNASGTATSTESGIGRFFSFGNTNTSEPTNTDSGDQNTNTNNNADNDSGGEAPVLREISSTPTASFAPAWDSIDGPLVRYIEQETGNVYEAPLGVVSKTRISNQTIPRVREAVWFPGGSGFIARYLSDNDSIESFSAVIKKATSTDEEGTLSGRFLQKDITGIAVITPRSATTSKNTVRIAYTTKDTDSHIYISNFDGTKSTKYADIKLNEVDLLPISESNILIKTKPSGLAGGALFAVNSRTGALDKVLGNYLGFSSVVSEDGNTVVFSALSENLPMLFVLNRKTGERVSLNLRSFADKCSFSIKNKEKIFCAVPNSVASGLNYPDAWLQGKVGFTDSVWEIDTKSFSKTKVVDGDKLNFFIDVDLISPSENDAYIIMRDKDTRSLWSVKI